MTLRCLVMMMFNWGALKYFRRHSPNTNNVLDMLTRTRHIFWELGLYDEGFQEGDVDTALGATFTLDEGEGQAKFNRKRQVAALDWLLINAPEANIPSDYKMEAAKARS